MALDIIHGNMGRKLEILGLKYPGWNSNLERFKVEAVMHKNQNDLEGIFDIGGLEFDQDLWYLPNYR